MVAEQAERNRVLQAEMYGEPLGELFRRIGRALGLTQARLAEVVGLSAPMLSQLMSGQRVKIGNPAVVHRMQTLAELASTVVEGGADAAEVERRIAEIKGASGVLSRSSTTGTPTTHTAERQADPRIAVRAVQDLFRAVASADEILGAAKLLEPTYPELAQLVRVYGAGRTTEAVAHYERVGQLD